MKGGGWGWRGQEWIGRGANLRAYSYRTFLVWRGILNTTGLWSEESVGTAWGLDIGHLLKVLRQGCLKARWVGNGWVDLGG